MTTTLLCTGVQAVSLGICHPRGNVILVYAKGVKSVLSKK